MGVKLKERVNGDGTTTFYLDIFFNKKRWTEFLTSIKLNNKPSNPAERQANKENRATAKRIALERAREIQSKDYSIEKENSKLVIVIDWMNDHAKKYKEKDIRVIEGVIKRFETFLKTNKKTGLLMKDLDSIIVEDFKKELKASCKGEGAKSYYSRFRKIIKAAFDEKVIKENPCKGIKPPKGTAFKKDTLSPAEIQLLAQTPTDAPEMKRAFLFSICSGLAWVDIKKLIWDSIDLKEKTITIVRKKLEEENKEYEIPLNGTAVKLLGEPGKKNELVFDLPTANGANKSLRLWVKRAKIDKKISWHCARHSVGRNLADSGVDIYVIGNILMHENLKYTKMYMRPSKELNKEAVDNLPEIDFSSSRIVEQGDTFSVISLPNNGKKSAKKK